MICCRIWRMRAWISSLLLRRHRRSLCSRASTATMAGTAQHVEGDLARGRSPSSSGDQLPAGHNRNVFEHRLAAVAKAGRLHRCNPETAAQAVDH